MRDQILVMDRLQNRTGGQGYILLFYAYFSCMSCLQGFTVLEYKFNNMDDINIL